MRPSARRQRAGKGSLGQGRHVEPRLTGAAARSSGTYRLRRAIHTCYTLARRNADAIPVGDCGSDAQPAQPLDVRRLAEVLEAVADDADEPLAGRDRRVPVLVDLALELALVDGLEVARSREGDLVVVGDEQLGIG